MALFEAVIVFVVGLISGTVTRWFAWLAAVAALVLAILGTATPDIALVGFVLERYYFGNELVFLSGFLFGIAGGSRSGA